MISVIIPNYNHAAYLKQRIDTVLGQTYANIEVIILDDHSTDDSINIIDNYRDDPRVNHISVNDSNTGSPFKQWQKGIILAKGEYIWIAESDDYSNLDFLEKMMAMLTADSDIVLCYANSDIVTDGAIVPGSEPSNYYNKLFRTERWNADFVNDGPDELTNYMGGFCTIINASSCVFRKAAFPVELADLSDFKYCGDWLVWIEMLMKGKIAYVARPLNYFRIHAGSTLTVYSKITKSRELYTCLTRARQLTSGKSIIPEDTLENFLYIWAHDSIYFLIKNFNRDLFMMHARLDPKFGRRILRSVKNYIRLKRVKN